MIPLAVSVLVAVTNWLLARRCAAEAVCQGVHDAAKVFMHGRCNRLRKRKQRQQQLLARALPEARSLHSGSVLGLGALRACRLLSCLVFVAALAMDAVETVPYEQPWLMYFTHWTFLGFGVYAFVGVCRVFQVQRRKSRRAVAAAAVSQPAAACISSESPTCDDTSRCYEQVPAEPCGREECDGSGCCGSSQDSSSDCEPCSQQLLGMAPAAKQPPPGLAPSPLAHSWSSSSATSVASDASCDLDSAASCAASVCGDEKGAGSNTTSKTSSTSSNSSAASRAARPAACGSCVSCALAAWHWADSAFHVLFQTVCAASMFLTVFYWLCVHDPANAALSSPLKHGVSAALMLADVVLSRMPILMRHAQVVTLYGTCYMIVMWVNWALTGTWVYAVLDWSKPESLIFYAMLPALLLVAYYIMFKLCQLRDSLLLAASAARGNAESVWQLRRRLRLAAAWRRARRRAAFSMSSRSLSRAVSLMSPAPLVRLVSAQPEQLVAVA